MAIIVLCSLLVNVLVDDFKGKELTNKLKYWFLLLGTISDQVYLRIDELMFIAPFAMNL